MTIATWCLFFAGLLHVLSKVPLFRAQLKSPQGYDNNHPRQQQQALDDAGKRALAAHQNQIESFPLFASGVLLSMVTGVTSNAVAYLCIAYVLARLVYLYCYVNNIATARTLIWGVGFLSSLALLCSPAWGLS